MREREKLEDFKGGHVACRGCKRLLFFAPEGLAEQGPMLCCGIAYVPTRHQIDLMIYDKLQPGEIEGAVAIPPPGPVIVTSHVPDGEDVAGRDNGAALSFMDSEAYANLEPLSDERFPGVEDDLADLDAMVVTPEEALVRRNERIETLKKRGRIDYG